MLWPATGRGRVIRQRTFGTYSLYRLARRACQAPAVAANYFFPVARHGTKALSQQNIAVGTNPVGVYFPVVCIPGQQYTTSVYVRQSDKNTQQISVTTAAGTVTGTSTTQILTWSRISVTFTATAPKHKINVQTTGQTAGGWVYYDCVQHEMGASASAWSLTGPTIYGVFSGFVERWPSNWLYQGTFGQAQIVAVDALAILAEQNLRTEFGNVVMTTSPDYYWNLAETSGATAFADSSGNGGPSLQVIDSKYGAGTISAGSQLNIPGDFGGSGIAFSGGSHTGTSTPDTGSAIQTGLDLTPQITAGGSTATWSTTVSFWVILLKDSGTQYQYMLRLKGAGASAPGTSATPTPHLSVFWSQGTPYQFNMQAGDGTHTTVQHASSDVTAYADGKPHLMTFNWAVGSGVIFFDAWIDGNSVISASNDCTTSFGTATPDFDMNVIMLAGSYFPASSIGGYQSTYSHLAIWNRDLTTDELFQLANSTTAAGGFLGEFPAGRISRYLGYNSAAIDYVPVGRPFAVGFTPSSTQMAVSNLSGGTSALDACTAVARSAGGRFFVTGLGTAYFIDRFLPYLTTTSKWTFGEQELPYVDLNFDFDPTQVYNDVHITRQGGAVAYTTGDAGGVQAVGGNITDIAASRKSYGPRSYSNTVNILDDNETQDAANWIFSTHKDPTQRVASLTLDPASNPALWDAALGARIGDRVTVKRRTSAAYTMSADFFIERIEHQRSAGQWTVSFQMSPAFTSAQPWILEDVTYGVLDSTTVLGY